jgi:hypothetical protein
LIIELYYNSIISVSLFVVARNVSILGKNGGNQESHIGDRGRWIFRQTSLPSIIGGGRGESGNLCG